MAMMVNLEVIVVGMVSILVMMIIINNIVAAAGAVVVVVEDEGVVTQILGIGMAYFLGRKRGRIMMMKIRMGVIEFEPSTATTAAS